MLYIDGLSTIEGGRLFDTKNCSSSSLNLLAESRGRLGSDRGTKKLAGVEKEVEDALW